MEARSAELSTQDFLTGALKPFSLSSCRGKNFGTLLLSLTKKPCNLKVPRNWVAMFQQGVGKECEECEKSRKADGHRALRIQQRPVVETLVPVGGHTSTGKISKVSWTEWKPTDKAPLYLRPVKFWATVRLWDGEMRKQEQILYRKTDMQPDLSSKGDKLLQVRGSPGQSKSLRGNDLTLCRGKQLGELAGTEFKEQWQENDPGQLDNCPTYGF